MFNSINNLMQYRRIGAEAIAYLLESCPYIGSFLDLSLAPLPIISVIQSAAVLGIWKAN